MFGKDYCMINEYNQKHPNTIWLVALYYRLSRADGDNMESESIANQRAFLQSYCAEHPQFKIVGEYTDDGFTGINFQRPDFQRLMKDCEKGTVNCIITKDLSRLGRDYIDVGKYLQHYFPENNIRYIAPLDNIDTALDNGENDIAPFKSVVNDMYVKDISRKIKASLYIKKKNGEFIGTTAPYGYNKNPNNKHQLIVNPTEANVVKDIFSLYLQGNGLTKIAQILTKRGIDVPAKTRNNNSTKRKTALYNSWKQTTIRRILQNEVYLGILVQCKRKNINYKSKKRVNVPKEERVYCYNTHEAIIDKETFEKAQQILSKNKSWKTTKHDYLFKGLLYCKECGARLNVTYSHYALKKYNEYRYTTICYSYSRLYSDICTRHSNNMNELEEALIKHIREVCQKYIKEGFEKELVKAAQDKMKAQSTTNTIEAEIKHLENKIKEYDNYIGNLYMDKVNGVIDAEQFVALSNNFKEQKTSYINRKIELEMGLSAHKNLEEQQDEIKKLAQNFLKMKKPTKELLLSLIDKIYVSENHEIEIYYKFKELNDLSVPEQI